MPALVTSLIRGRKIRIGRQRRVKLDPLRMRAAFDQRVQFFRMVCEPRQVQEIAGPLNDGPVEGIETGSPSSRDRAWDRGPRKRSKCCRDRRSPAG